MSVSEIFCNIKVSLFNCLCGLYSQCHCDSLVKLYGESDKIVTFFTREFGKLKGDSKGSAEEQKVVFRMPWIFFSLLRLVFYDREGNGARPARDM